MKPQSQHLSRSHPRYGEEPRKSEGGETRADDPRHACQQLSPRNELSETPKGRAGPRTRRLNESSVRRVETFPIPDAAVVSLGNSWRPRSSRGLSEPQQSRRKKGKESSASNITSRLREPRRLRSRTSEQADLSGNLVPRSSRGWYS